MPEETRSARPWPRRLGVTVGITVAVCGVVWLLENTSAMRYLDMQGYDAFITARPPRPDRRIALVVLDESTHQRYRAPRVLWNRHFADLFRGLAAAGAKTAGIDVLFAIPLNEYLPGQDELLSQAYLETSANGAFSIILGHEASESLAGHAPVYMLAASQDRIGFLNLTQDPDGAIRRQELRAASSDAGDRYSFAVQLAAHYLDRPPGAVLEPLKSALDAERALQIAYRGNGAFETTPFADAVEAARRNDIAFLRKRFGGRAVLVGQQGFEDRHITPASSPAAGGSGERMNGVEIHANTLSTLLDADPVRPIGRGRRRLLLALIVAATAGAAVFGGPLAGAVTGSSLLAAFIALGFASIRRSVFLSPAGAVAGVPLAFAAAVSWRSMVENRARRRLRRVFAQYVPGRVIDEVLESETAQFAGRRVPLTVLFSDVRDFTTISENLEPEVLMAQLNEYFAAMTQIVVEHDGVVDKFIGDGLLALFGAPVPREDHASRAVSAARRMQGALVKLNEKWEAEGRPRFRIGIGVHTGDAVVGNLGSERKVEYTALGDTVNVASRVESATKNFSAPILISDSTLRAIGSVPDAEDVGTQQLKGKTKGVRLYRLGGAG